MKILLLLLALTFAAPTLAQFHPREKGQGKSHVSQEERRRIREDVDSARGNYDRRDGRRAERMGAEEREKLRRDVQDANRDLRRR